MDLTLALASAAILACDVWLVAICWRQRAVLSGVCGLAGIALVVVAVAGGGGGSTAIVVGSLVSLMIGTALLALGRFVDQLLTSRPEEEPDVAARGVRPQTRLPLALILAGAALALLLASCGGRAGGEPGPSPRASTSTNGGVLITVRSSQYGRILSDGSNRTIYLFTRDRGTTSSCYGACASGWPPVLGRALRDSRLTGRLSTTRRSDGSLQVTYASHPLYYYVGDVKPGQILCQDVTEFGGTWLVSSVHGTPVR